MLSINRMLEHITYLMHMLSGTLLVSMMFITLADVFSRALFAATNGQLDITFIGGVELIKYALLGTVFFSLPYSLRRSQVIVDLFSDNWSHLAKRVVDAFYMTLFILLASCMSYQFFHLIAESQLSGETTQDLLIPLSYFYQAATFATAMLAVAAVQSTIQIFFKHSEEQS